MKGIYRIICLENHKEYIGSSTNIPIRWKNHRNTLNRNVHKNAKLQADWLRYGESAFRFDILEVTDNIILAEQLHIDNCQAELYNVSTNAWNPMRNPETVKKHQNSLNASGKRGSQKLQDQDVLEIIKLLEQGWSVSKVAANFNVDISTIYAIRSGKSWSRVTGITDGKKQVRIGDREIATIKQRLSENVKIIDIAKELGVCSRTVKNWAIKLGIYKSK